jgi:excisionase family DNA binding protein
MATVMNQASKFVTVEAAAELIGCTDGRVRQLLRNGDLPGEKLSERVWLILRKDAEKYALIPYKTGRPKNSSRSA